MTLGYFKGMSKEQILTHVHEHIVKTVAENNFDSKLIYCGYVMCLLDMGIIDQNEYDLFIDALTGGKKD